MNEHSLDFRNLYCPEPIIQLNKIINEFEDQSTIKVLASDPAFYEEIKAWCSAKGHQLIQITDDLHIEATIIKA